MPVKLRFAPSPTGLLQVGNARVAVINWLFARRHGGAMLLRLDDTDAVRSTEAYADAAVADLRWLGLDWDERARQSDRLDHYAAAASRLREAGRLYPCYETAEELDAKRKAQEARGRPPVYDRSALRLSAEDRARLEREGRRPHWRFQLSAGSLAWEDLVRGRQGFQTGSLSDPVLVREDGRPLYTLTSVVDDIAFAITDVVRGEDHVANTAAQIQIFEALGAAPPRFAHLPLLTDMQGRKLSKREADLSLQALREEEEIEPLALVSYLARLGTPDPIDAAASLEALVAEFDIARFGRATPKFGIEELRRLNERVLHDLTFDAVADRLRSLGLDKADEAFWLAVRPNLARLSETVPWYEVCRGEVSPIVDDPAFLSQAADLLPAEPWDETTWGAWTAAVKTATGRKGAALFKPLRKALTGRDHGPELKALLPLIGRAKAEARLRGETA